MCLLLQRVGEHCSSNPLKYDVIRGISVHYLEAAILEDRNILASYAVSIEMCPTSLVSLYIAYISIKFHSIQCFQAIARVTQEVQDAEELQTVQQRSEQK